MDDGRWQLKLVDAATPTKHVVGLESAEQYYKSVTDASLTIATGELAEWADTTSDGALLPFISSVELEQSERWDEIEQYAKKLLAACLRTDRDMTFGAAIYPQKRDIEEHTDLRFAHYAREAMVAVEVGFEFLHIFDATSLEEGRAALLAAKESGDIPVFVSFSCDEEGMVGECDLLAALAVMQSLGCDMFGISCYNMPSVVIGQIARLYPYATVPLFAKLDAYETEGYESALMSPGKFGAYTRLALEAGAQVIFTGAGASGEYAKAVRTEIEGFKESDITAEEKDKEALLSATPKEVHFIDPMLDISEPIYVGTSLDEDIFEAEEEGYTAVKIHLRDVDDFEMFEESLYMLELPLCLSADDLSLFERAAMIYPGRAIYDGTCDFDERELAEVIKRYGIIEL